MNNITLDDFFLKLICLIESKDEYVNCETGIEFEGIVKENLSLLTKDAKFKFEDNGKHAFPDLSIKLNDSVFGLEVKYSASGNWSSNANSVFESISNKEEDAYKDIYVIFARKPKKKEQRKNLEVKIKKYSDIISNISVTHSPRFLIDMNDKNKSFFSELNISYEKFRILDNSEKNVLLRKYFSKKNEQQDKWYIPLDINEEEGNVLPQRFSELEEELQDRLRAEAFILYPTDLLRKRAIYTRVEEYYLNNYFIISSALRDKFTSGGKAIIENFNEFKFPKMITTYKKVRPIIEELLTNPSEEFIDICYKAWKKQTTLEKLKLENEINIKDAYLKIESELSMDLEVENYLEEKKEMYTLTMKQLDEKRNI